MARHQPEQARPATITAQNLALWWSARRAFTLLLHLPRRSGHGRGARVKNGPALAGHGGEAVRDATARTIITLPEELRRPLIWDHGTEMASIHASRSTLACWSTSAIPRWAR
jgi:hypothetical protein